MARQPRIHYPGALFHAMARGNGGQRLFLDDSYYECFLDIVDLVRKELPFSLYAYCLMPNHFHFLLQVDEFPISMIMQRIMLRFAKRFNYRRRRFGHVFQGRFKAILCESNSYLLELLRYIHLNPVRAKLVGEPADWAWSGHRQYLGLPGTRELADLTVPLSAFHEDVWHAQELYAKFVQGGIGQGHRKDFYPPLKLPCLGSKDFRGRFNDRLHYPMPQRRVVSLPDLAEEVAGAFEPGSDGALLLTRRHHASAVKRAFISQAHDAGYKSVEIAAFLGRSPSAVTRLLQSPA